MLLAIGSRTRQTSESDGREPVSTPAGLFKARERGILVFAIYSKGKRRIVRVKSARDRPHIVVHG
jgi:hypothetical protein